MLYLIVGILGILMGFFGIVSNLYILLVILFSKKQRSISEWILLHLSSCGIVASTLTLCFSSPSIILTKWISSVEPLCDIVGASILTLQLLTVWSICALSVDRCSAIVSPLRYTQVVTRRRTAAFFITFWCLSITMVVMAFSFSSTSYSSVHEVPVSNHNHGNVHQTLSELESFHSSSNNVHPTPSPPSILLHQNTNFLPFPTGPSYKVKYNHHMQLQHQSDNYYEFTTTVSTSNTNTNNYQDKIGLLDLYFATQKRLFIKNADEIRKDDDDDDENTSDSNLDSTSYSYNLNGDNYYGDVVDTGKVNIGSGNSTMKYRSSLGFCLPNIYHMSFTSLLWVGEWTVFIFVAPLCTLLICDLTVLSIAKKQRHRIVMALYQITLSAQATVTRSKGTAPPSLWMSSQTVPAKSRACRAVWEDVATIVFLNLPLIIILVIESLFLNVGVPPALTYLGSLSFFLTPMFTSLLHGVRARPLRTAYKSYLRKRLTNSTLQHEIEQRLSPVDGSPRASSRVKGFRSSTPSPSSSPFQSPHRRLSTNDLRPPATTQLSLTLSPSQVAFGSSEANHQDNNCVNKPRKVRSFLHIPSQQDMQEFWSSLRKPNRSPTIVITHELRTRQSNSSFSSSKSSTPPINAEHLV